MFIGFFMFRNSITVVSYCDIALLFVSYMLFFVSYFFLFNTSHYTLFRIGNGVTATVKPVKQVSWLKILVSSI